jgi:K319-like protein
MNTNCRKRVLYVLSLAMVAGLTSAPVFAGSGGGGPPPCSVTAKISPDNQNHVVAGTSTNGVFTPTSVQLNGQPSGPANTVSYSWVQTDGIPTVKLSDPTAAQPTFTAPDISPSGTTLTFKLTVTGSSSCSPSQASATTMVTVSYVQYNQAPVAAATVTTVPPTDDGSVSEGGTFTLDGSASSDPDGNPLTYVWEQIGDPAATLVTSTGATSTYTAPEVPYPNGATLTFRLTVSDGYLSNSTDVSVTVKWVNDPPVAKVTCPTSVNEYAQVTLDGSASTDNDGDGIASYSWSQTLGEPNADLPQVDPSQSIISFTAPQLTQYPLDTMYFKLSVTDNGGLFSSDKCEVKVNDITPPTISAAATTSPNGNNGWYKSDVTVHFTCDDAYYLPEGDCPPDQLLSTEGGAVSSTAQTVMDGAKNVSDPSNVVTVKIDKTRPTITAAATTDPDGTNGWYKSNVTVHFTCSDAISGIPDEACPADQLLSAEGIAVSSTAQTVTDNAGNISAPSEVVTVMIDRTAPSVTWNGGPEADGTYYYGFVPDAPTCTAADALSGPDGCSVTGYYKAIGPHTLTATAKDKAGNQTTETRSYEVKAWTLKGFYQPVDMGSSVLNTVKGGSTVPLKFNVYAGTTELTSTSAVKSFTAGPVPCSGGTEDAVDITTTGGTSLRYDTTAGQFIQNWQTPKGAGLCYRVTMSTQDGSSISALFKTK